MNEEIQKLRKLKTACDRISGITTKDKERVIAKEFEDDEVAEAIIMLLNPLVTIGIGEKSLSKTIPKNPNICYKSLIPMCRRLSVKKGINDQDIKNVQDYIRRVRECNDELADFAVAFISKTLTIGVTAKTVNKALGKEVIPEFRCMLANKYFEHQSYVEGKEFTLTLKMDGIRCLCVFDGKRVTFYTRQGQVIEGLDEISTEILFAFDDKFVLDGELLIDGGLDMESKTAYKLTTQIVRKDGPKNGIIYHVFDYMPFNDFMNRRSYSAYRNRRGILNGFAVQISLLGLRHMRIVPAQYRGTDTNEIIRVLDKVRSMNQEGVMINIDDANYQFRRTNELLKVKVMNDCDLEIIGVQEGTGRFKGTLGSLVVSYKGNPVGVGSGLSDDMRKMIWEDPQKFIGRIATIQYFEETKDKTGKLSIRFPVFKEQREEGKEVSYS